MILTWKDLFCLSGLGVLLLLLLPANATVPADMHLIEATQFHADPGLKIVDGEKRPFSNKFDAHARPEDLKLRGGFVSFVIKKANGMTNKYYIVENKEMTNVDNFDIQIPASRASQKKHPGTYWNINMRLQQATSAGLTRSMLYVRVTPVNRSDKIVEDVKVIRLVGINSKSSTERKITRVYAPEGVTKLHGRSKDGLEIYCPEFDLLAFKIKPNLEGRNKPSKETKPLPVVPED